MNSQEINWIDELERRRSFILLLLLLVITAVLALSSLRDSYSFDAFWHLKMGQDWVEKGFSPFQDHYSIVFNGTEVRPPYLFQLLLYGFVALFGQSLGFKMLVFSSGLLALALMMGWLKRVHAPVVVVCLTVSIVVLLIQQRAMVRPEIFSYSFMILSLILCEKARTGDATRTFPFIALTMLLWTNYHSSILGYVIFFGLFVDLFLQQVKGQASLRNWATWAGWGLLIALFGFLNPSISHPLLSHLAFSDEWKSIIQEYRSPFAGSPGPVTIAYFLLAGITLLLSLKQKLFGYALVNGVFLWAAYSMERMITPAGIVAACILALTLSNADKAFSRREPPQAARKALTVGLGVLFLTVLVNNVMTARQLVFANRYLVGKFPDQLVKYMQNTGRSGNIFNNDAIGGYLIYHLGDHSRVYIDSRTNILYPFKFNQRFRDALQDPDLLRSEILEHDIDYLILGNRQERVDLAHLTGLMQLDYSDLRFSLYSRENANFPVSGALWSTPWCWDGQSVDELSAEMERAGAILPAYSPLLHLVRLASRFSLAGNSREFLEDIANGGARETYESSIRFAGYRAVELGLYDLAIRWFSSLENVVLKDYLVLALAHIRTGNTETAELIISDAIRTNWSLPVYNDFRLIQGLLAEIDNTGTLNRVEKEYFDEVTSSIGENAIPVAQKPVSVADFCAR